MESGDDDFHYLTAASDGAADNKTKLASTSREAEGFCKSWGPQGMVVVTLTFALFVTIVAIALPNPSLDVDMTKPSAADSRTLGGISLRVANVAKRASVQTLLGSVHGLCDAASCRYLNVSFAEPFARFETSAVRTAPYPSGGVGGSKFGPACMQFLTPELQGVYVGPQSEDCLQLNIFTPARRLSNPLLPTMVWIPGGGFIMGSDAERDDKIQTLATYDGSKLAVRGAIIVTTQYRLGIFGFLPTADGVGGANGFGDQLSALKWVKSHIHNFGGSPDSVTIFGESSGAVSVCTLAHIPQAQGLFQRVVLESGVCFPSGDVLLSGTEAREVRKSYVEKISLSSAELHSLPAVELVNRTLTAYPGFSNFFASGVGQPSVDGDILPAMPMNLKPLPVDMLLGYCSDELPPPPKNASKDSLRRYFGRNLGQATVDEIFTHYDSQTPWDIVNDACMLCEHAELAHRFAHRHGAQVHFYIYDYPHNGAVHGAGVPAMFGNGGLQPDPPANLVEQVQKVLIDIATGKNLTHAEPLWSEVSQGFPLEAMVLRDPLSVHVTSIGSDVCSLWVPALHRAGGWNVQRMCAGLWPY